MNRSLSRIGGPDLSLFFVVPQLQYVLLLAVFALQSLFLPHQDEDPSLWMIPYLFFQSSPLPVGQIAQIIHLQEFRVQVRSLAVGFAFFVLYTPSLLLPWLVLLLAAQGIFL